uniref:Homeobox protein Nkx-2.1-like n=1 Tax=Diabrotica virgifera virgifera TaxID=50390 RepID=A0A6P7GHD6_DIAVI
MSPDQIVDDNNLCSTAGDRPSSSSPRRVAVPVLVKDGKPCSGGGNNTNQTATSSASSDTSRTQQSPACQPPQQQTQCMANSGLAMAYRQQGNYQQQCAGYLPLQTRAW